MHETKPENHPQLMLGVCSVGRELTSSNVFMSWLLPVNGGGGSGGSWGCCPCPRGWLAFAASCQLFSQSRGKGKGVEWPARSDLLLCFPFRHAVGCSLSLSLPFSLLVCDESHFMLCNLQVFQSSRICKYFPSMKNVVRKIVQVFV